MKPSTQRRKIDPQPGDRFRESSSGDIVTVEVRAVRRPNEYIYGLGKVKEYIGYRLARHRGCLFHVALSGFVLRIKDGRYKQIESGPK